MSIQGDGYINYFLSGFTAWELYRERVPKYKNSFYKRKQTLNKDLKTGHVERFGMRKI